MKQILQNMKTGELKISDVPPPIIRRGGILVKNLYSLISVGTERMVIDLAKKNYIGKATARPDLVKQVLNKVKNEGMLTTFQKVMGKLEEPIALGYSSVGQVIEVGNDVDEFQVGDFVACAGGGFATHSEIIFVPKNLAIKLESTTDLKQAAYVTLGGIAMQGLRQAEVSLGENVAVIGLGLLGQITVQLLKAAGCQVIGIDLDERKIALAQKHGMDVGVILGQEDAVQKVMGATKGYGADKIIITAATKDNGPVEMAGEIARDRAIISMVGAVGMNIPRKVYYEKELDLRLSRAYGPGRYDVDYEEKGLDYPIGYVRWTEKRNMEEFIRLITAGVISMNTLTTHLFDIENADQAYQMVLENPNKERFIGVLLEYKQNFTRQGYEKKVFTSHPAKSYNRKEKVTIGLIGAGNFTKVTMLPILTKNPHLVLKGVSTAKGINAQMVAEKYGFEYAVSDYQEILKDPDIDLVIITTTHNLHARMTIEAMAHNKDVYVEKPLAINEEELCAVYQAQQKYNKRILVGFNRRFAPLVQKTREAFTAVKEPLLISYRVNAGLVPPDHWINDLNIGGGRIIGEVCHFIDLIQYLTQANPIKVYAEKMSGSNESILNEDNVFITIKYEDGSVGSIFYNSVGDKSFPKERVEIFGGGCTAVIDDYRTGSISRKETTNQIKLSNQDKGFKNEYDQMIQAILRGEDFPIRFEELLVETYLTFKVRESLHTGKPVEINIHEIFNGEVAHQ